MSTSKPSFSMAVNQVPGQLMHSEYNPNVPDPGGGEPEALRILLSSLQKTNMDGHIADSNYMSLLSVIHITHDETDKDNGGNKEYSLET